MQHAAPGRPGPRFFIWEESWRSGQVSPAMRSSIGPLAQMISEHMKEK